MSPQLIQTMFSLSEQQGRLETMEAYKEGEAIQIISRSKVSDLPILVPERGLQEEITEAMKNPGHKRKDHGT